MQIVTTPAARKLFALLIALLVAGCGTTAAVRNSASLLELDKQWASLYKSRLEAERATPGSGAAFNSRLADLSSRAEISGDTASAGNPASAVGFYRIAATAAWSAGAPRNVRVLPVRDKGAEACARLPNGAASQPRDCAFIAVAPLLAILDEKLADVRKLRDADSTLSGDQLDAAQSLTQTLSQTLQKILQERTAAGVQVESFDDFLALTVNRGFCTLPGLVGRIANSMPPPVLLERVRSDARQAQDALRNALIPTTCN